METMINAFKWISGGIAAVLSWVFGSPDTLLYVLITMTIADYLTGLLCGFASKTLSSATGFKGLAKKILIFVLVGVGAMLDRLLPGANGALRAAVCGFYIANEGISILENAAKLGLPLPKVLKDALEQLSDDDSNKV